MPVLRTLEEIENDAVEQLEGIADDVPTRDLIREAYASGRARGIGETDELVKRGISLVTRDDRAETWLLALRRRIAELPSPPPSPAPGGDHE